MGKYLFHIVDLGANLTKVHSKKLQFKTSSEEIEENAYLNDILKYNNKIYKVGIGEPERQTIKVKRKNYIIPLLYSIGYGETEKDLDVDLCLMLPRNQMGTAGEYSILKNTFECTVNGIDHNIKINNIHVLPEGQCGYYALSKELRKQNILVFDLGGSTLDASLYFGKKEQRATSIPMGITKFFDEISNIIANDKDHPMSYSYEKIEALMSDAKQKAKLEERYPKILEAGNKFLAKAEEKLRNDLAAFDEVDNVVFIGGGSETLRTQIDNITNSIILEEQQNIYANCIGAANICKGKKLIKSENDKGEK